MAKAQSSFMLVRTISPVLSRYLLVIVAKRLDASRCHLVWR